MTNTIRDHIGALTNAGLSHSQARVYCGLLSVGPAKIARISKIINMDRSNVYKAINDLEKLGLIEQYIGSSMICKAIPLQIAISILSNRKKQEYFNVLNGLEKFAKEVEITETQFTLKGDYFHIIPAGTETFSRKWEKTLKNIKHSVDLIVTEYREIKDEPIWNIYDDLLQKGVKVRWLFDRSTKDDQEFILRVKQFEHLLNYQDLYLKVCIDCLRPYGGILDNKTAVIILDEEKTLKCTRTLWTNNTQILLNFKKHFEAMWNKAISCPVKIEVQ